MSLIGNSYHTQTSNFNFSNGWTMYPGTVKWYSWNLQGGWLKGKFPPSFWRYSCYGPHFWIPTYLLSMSLPPLWLLISGNQISTQDATWPKTQTWCHNPIHTSHHKKKLWVSCFRNSEQDFQESRKRRDTVGLPNLFSLTPW